MISRIRPSLDSSCVFISFRVFGGIAPRALWHRFGRFDEIAIQIYYRIPGILLVCVANLTVGRKKKPFETLGSNVREQTFSLSVAPRVLL